MVSALPLQILVRKNNKALEKTEFHCSKSKSPPAPGDKLRSFGCCAAVPYCSKHCAKVDWPPHKLECDGMRRARDEALADHETRGGRKQDFNQMNRDVVSWCKAVPGLFNEIQLLVWAHHSESPIIHASAANQSDADGSDIRVEMILRSFWDEDPRFLETYTDTAEKSYGKSMTSLRSVSSTSCIRWRQHTPTAIRGFTVYSRAVSMTQSFVALKSPKL